VDKLRKDGHFIHKVINKWPADPNFPLRSKGNGVQSNAEAKLRALSACALAGKRA
jgi:hypothetical protein